MDKQGLLDYFLKNYHPRQEIVYRLPMSVPISEFWPEELRYRRNQAFTLPLRTAGGESFWYVPTGKLLQAGDSLSQAARYENTNTLPQYGHDESMIDEAYYSSAIEGAYSTSFFRRFSAQLFLKRKIFSRNSSQPGKGFMFQVPEKSHGFLQTERSIRIQSPAGGMVPYRLSPVVRKSYIRRLMRIKSVRCWMICLLFLPWMTSIL